MFLNRKQRRMYLAGVRRRARKVQREKAKANPNYKESRLLSASIPELGVREEGVDSPAKADRETSQRFQE